MKHVKSSEATHAALREACGKVVSRVLLAGGDWHHPREYLGGAYELGSLRLEMEDGGVLEFWSEYLRPITDSRCEPLVLAARYRAAGSISWTGAAAGVELRWWPNGLLSRLLAGRKILGFENSDIETGWPGDEDILVSNGMRMDVTDDTFQFIINVQPANLIFKSQSMSIYQSKPTEEI